MRWQIGSRVAGGIGGLIQSDFGSIQSPDTYDILGVRCKVPLLIIRRLVSLGVRERRRNLAGILSVY